MNAKVEIGGLKFVMFRNIRCLIVFIAVLGIFNACRKPELVTGKPNRTTLAGKWTVDEGSLKYIERLDSLTNAKSENTIELNQDGTCRFKTYSVFGPTGKYFDSNGTWDVEETSFFDTGKTAWEIQLKIQNDTIGSSFFVGKRGDEPVLFTYFDDPDQNQVVQFNKK